MEKHKSSLLTPVAFAFLLVVLTVSTVYFFWARTWWFPESITALGRDLDAQFGRTLIITGIVFVLSQLGLAYAVIRYRSRGGRAKYDHGNTTMEILWTTATLIMFVGLGIAAERSWADFHFIGSAPGAMKIEVTGQQFQWYFRYPGPDGQFGSTKPELADEATGNPLGLDPADARGRDDIVTPILGVPANREVEVILRTKDVTHSFFVRELRFKQDTVPGMEIHLHFIAEKPGKYEIACAELCGLGHYRMRADMVVVPEADFDNWLRQQAALSAGQ